MTSALSIPLGALLEKLGFSFIKKDPKTHNQIWLSQEQLPHIQIHLNPAEHTTVPDIVRLIYHAGAAAQRDATRTALNHLINTFRAGQKIEPLEDLLAIQEPTQPTEETTHGH